MQTDVSRTVPPLQVLLAPMQITTEAIDATWSEIESNATQALSEFLDRFYPQHGDRAIEFLAGAWTNHSLQREARIKALFEQLQHQPTLIIETELTRDRLSIRIAYWGLGQSHYRYCSIVSLPYPDLLATAVKRRALLWKETAQQLLDCGETPESIYQLGSDNAVNLALYEKELRWQQQGIDTRLLSLPYQTRREDFTEIEQLLVACLGAIASWVGDLYYLIHSQHRPLLSDWLLELPAPINSEWLQAVWQSLGDRSQDLFTDIEAADDRIPNLALQFAESLQRLPDLRWMRQQVEYSQQAWFRQRATTLAQSQFRANDLPYLIALRRCLVVADTTCVAQIDRLLSALPLLESSTISPFQPPLSRCQAPQSALLSAPWNPVVTQTLTGYSGKAAALELSLDGQILVSSSEDRNIKFWHLQSGKLQQTLHSKSGRILALALSPDGRTLASSHRTSDRSWIQLWDVQSGKPGRSLTGHNKWIYALAISPDGQTLVSGGQKIKIWDLATGTLRCTLNGHQSWVYALAISPDNQTLASASGDKTIKIWNLATGTTLQQTLTGHQDWVRTIAYVSDRTAQSGQSSQLASGSDDSTIKLWDLATGTLIRTLHGHTDCVLAVAIAPDGQSLISGSKDCTIKIWHLATGELLQTLTGHKKWVDSLAIAPDGQTLASGSQDKTIKIWRSNIQLGEKLLDCLL